ncbi:MAG: ATP-binding cassette domain-containing protein [Thermoguttaceae bacterium]
MPQKGALLEAEHIGRRHPDGKTWLLEDVTLAIEPGARLALIGPSGAGKTLLLRALARLDPLDRGEVRYRGQGIHHNALPHYRASAIYLHQRAALIEDTVEAALRKPYTLNVHRHRRFDGGRVVDLLSDLGRDAAFLEKKVTELSGGEIQITALARALQLDPTILFLDEPTAALDGPTATTVEQLIDRWLAQSAQRAMIWVSHNEAQARRVARTAIRMEAGRLK